MSVKALAAVFALGRGVKLSAAERLALLGLADHANEDLVCWPSHESLSEKCGVNRRAMIYTVENLVTKGFVGREHRTSAAGRPDSNVYRLNLSPIVQTSAPSRDGDGANACTNDGANVCTGVVQTFAQEPSMNRQLNHHSPTPSVGTDSEGPDGEGGAGPGRALARRARRPDLLWDAVCGQFGLTPQTKAERSRVGRIVRDLKVKGAGPGDVAARLAAYRRVWPAVACTPEALLKHWDRFGPHEGNGNGNGATAGPLATVGREGDYANGF